MRKVAIVITLSYLLFQFHAKAQGIIDSLETVLKTAKEDTNKVNTLNFLGRELINTGDYDKAKEYATVALSLSQKINLPDGSYEFKKGEAKSYRIIGIIYYFQGNYPAALKNHLEALKLYEKTEDKKGIAASYSNIGLVYQNQGQYEDALKNDLAALKIQTAIKDSPSIAITYNNMGIINKEHGNYEEALKNHFAALKIREEIGDKQGVAMSYVNIGNAYLEISNYPDALKNYFASLKISEEIGYKQGIASNDINIGRIYVLQLNYNEAIKYLMIALKIGKEIGDKQGIAESYLSLAIIYNKQSHNDESLKNNLEARKIFEEIGDMSNVADAYNHAGETYVNMGKYDDALLNLNKGLKIATSINEKRIMREIYSLMAEVYKKLNDYKKAFEYHSLYSEIKDTILNESNSKQIAEMKTKYETEKKDKEIQLLNKDKEIQATELKRQTLIRNFTFWCLGIAGTFSYFLFRSFNRRRKTSFEKQVSEVEMKALRSQMNPHFIFNALQSVNDFILKKDTMNASNFLIKFSKLMRTVLENSVHKEVPLENDLATLELYMQLESSRLDQPFEYEIIVDPKIDSAETLIPPLILQPFVENSIWHGLKHKKEKGKIKIEIKEENNSIVCSIEDNGVGREQAAMLKEPVPEKRESLGMKLTKERLKILEQVKNFRSRIDVTDLKDAMNNPLGLRVELSLPLATLS